jgi:AmmeMemoRadiSam system protein A
MLPPDAGAALLPIARAAIARAVGCTAPVAPEPAWLQEPGASFVTLMQGHALRGCIGSLQARRSLLEDVQSNAVAAALHDPRFKPLAATELEVTRVEVSVLSPMQTLVFGSEADALAQLQPGVDGVVFEYGPHRSTFLPQVWEQLPERSAFLAQLKRKAGLSGDFWDHGVKLWRYTVHKWSESETDSNREHAPTNR